MGLNGKLSTGGVVKRGFSVSGSTLCGSGSDGSHSLRCSREQTSRGSSYALPGTGWNWSGALILFFLVVNISLQPIRGPGLAMCSGFVLPELSLGNAGLERPPQPLSVAAFQHGDASGLLVSLTDCDLRRMTAWV